MANLVDWGFQNLQHLANTRLTEIGTSTVDTQVQLVLDYHNRGLNSALGAWAMQTTEHQQLVHLMPGGTLEPLTEDGAPTVRKPALNYTVAYPIDTGGQAWGDNRVVRAYMTVAEVQRNLNYVINADTEWNRRHMLASVFDNTNRTYTDRLYGSLTVMPLANGDTQTYNVRSSSDPTTDTHYLAQANAIGAGADNPFPTIRAELNEHPSNFVTNTNPVVVFVPTNLVSSIEELADFREYKPGNLIVPGISEDRAGEGIARFLLMGDEIIGVVNKCVIIEWAVLPDNYMIAWASGAGKFLRMREHEPPELQNLYREFFSPDGNHNEYRYIRMRGYGVFDRTAALVYRIGNAAYAIPTDYSTPAIP